MCFFRGILGTCVFNAVWAVFKASKVERIDIVSVVFRQVASDKVVKGRRVVA